MKCHQPFKKNLLISGVYSNYLTLPKLKNIMSNFVASIAVMPNQLLCQIETSANAFGIVNSSNFPANSERALSYNKSLLTHAYEHGGMQNGVNALWNSQS